MLASSGIISGCCVCVSRALRPRSTALTALPSSFALSTTPLVAAQSPQSSPSPAVAASADVRHRRQFWTRGEPTIGRHDDDDKHCKMPSVAPVKVQKPFIIGCCGGTASGKSTVCKRILAELLTEQKRQVALICQDAFYRDLNPEEQELAKTGDFNFDHPDAIDTDLLIDTIRQLKQGNTVHVPTYDYVNNCRTGEFETVEPKDVVLLEGILIFNDAQLRDMFNMKVFVEVDSDIRLGRRVNRDLKERGRNIETILHQYQKFVKPCYEEFCMPTKKYADIIIPNGAENNVAIDLIVRHIQETLRSPPTTPRSTPGVEGTAPMQKQAPSSSKDMMNNGHGHVLQNGTQGGLH